MARVPWSELTDEELFWQKKLMTVVKAEVQSERNRQNNKWGKQRHTDDTWLSILVEEVGEVAQAINSKSFAGKPTDADDIYKELIQVAAVAMAHAEQVLENRIQMGEYKK